MKVITLRQWVEERQEALLSAALDNICAHPEFKEKMQQAIYDITYKGFAVVKTSKRK